MLSSFQDVTMDIKKIKTFLLEFIGDPSRRVVPAPPSFAAFNILFFEWMPIFFSVLMNKVNAFQF